jgi:hypothetical protein
MAARHLYIYALATAAPEAAFGVFFLEQRAGHR